MKSIRRIKVKLQETMKPNISNKSRNILGDDHVEQFMQRRNVEVSLALWFTINKQHILCFTRCFPGKAGLASYLSYLISTGP